MFEFIKNMLLHISLPHLIDPFKTNLLEHSVLEMIGTTYVPSFFKFSSCDAQHCFFAFDKMPSTDIEKFCDFFNYYQSGCVSYQFSNDMHAHLFIIDNSVIVNYLLPTFADFILKKDKRTLKTYQDLSLSSEYVRGKLAMYLIDDLLKYFKAGSKNGRLVAYDYRNQSFWFKLARKLTFNEEKPAENYLRRYLTPNLTSLREAIFTHVYKGNTQSARSVESRLNAFIRCNDLELVTAHDNRVHEFIVKLSSLCKFEIVYFIKMNSFTFLPFSQCNLARTSVQIQQLSRLGLYFSGSDNRKVLLPKEIQALIAAFMSDSDRASHQFGPQGKSFLPGEHEKWAKRREVYERNIFTFFAYDPQLKQNPTEKKDLFVKTCFYRSANSPKNPARNTRD